MARRYALGSRVVASALAGWVAGGLDGLAAVFGLGVGLVFGVGDHLRQLNATRGESDVELAARSTEGAEQLAWAVREVAERDRRARDGVPVLGERGRAHTVLGCADARQLPCVQYLRP